MTDPIRILVVDDHAIVREGLRLIFETVDDIVVAGEASDGAEGLEMVKSLKPDVVMMDLRMPGMDGLTAIKHLSKDFPEIAVIILTTYNEDEMMLKGLKAGARGYLLKDTAREPLFNSIRAAARGETLLSPEVMARVLSQAGKDAGAKVESSAISLTDREQEVLVGVSEGKTSKEIAYQLGITERTIKAHLTSIYNKLGVDSRAAAVSEAAKRGWL